MKKLVILSLSAFTTFLTLTACGGKEMNAPPDGSSSGPSYRNESEPYHRQDTVVTNRED